MTDAAPAERTYQHDMDLPRLPLPALEDTLRNLDLSVKGCEYTPEEWAAFETARNDAKTALAKAQEALAARDAKFENHYMGEWWEEYAYLRNRYPNVINTNVFCVRDSDFVTNDEGVQIPAPVLNDPVERAALCALELMEFRRYLAHEILPVDKFIGKPMCMDQYRRYFSTRVPGLECDTLHVNDPKDVDEVHFMVNGQGFFVKMRADKASDKTLNFQETVAAIRFGMDSLKAKGSSRCRVGAMTTADRTKWATARDLLIKQNDENKTILERIQNAATTICIDFNEDSKIESIDQGIHYASHVNPTNRWFDRSVLKQVTVNGMVVENGDHTAMDAIVMASVPMDSQIMWGKGFIKKGGNKVPVSEGYNPEAVVAMGIFETNEEIEKMIDDALAAHEEVSKTKEIGIFRYKKLGRAALKAAKVSADGFFQQIIQLAFMQDRKRIAPAYESASTRFFHHGRTDVIRPLTAQQRTLMTAMANPSVSPAEKQKAFGAAMKAHTEISHAAAGGKGVDRHLMSLKLAQSTILQEPLPALFSDPLFLRAQSYELLTSSMVGSLFLGGFAHALPDGYGVCYYLRQDEICAVIACDTSKGLTSVERFKKKLAGVLDMASALIQPPAEA